MTGKQLPYVSLRELVPSFLPSVESVLSVAAFDLENVLVSGDEIVGDTLPRGDGVHRLLLRETA